MLLTYENIKGKRGVWLLCNKDGTSHDGEPGTVFVSDGHTAWHGTLYGGPKYCCSNQHRDYQYRPMPQYKVAQFAESAQRGKVTIEIVNDRRLLLCEPF